jgi:glycine dehydrogenase
MGFSNTITPTILLRNMVENPLWYTPYTPYQSEISQGRMESLLNFQTMVTELSGMGAANASLLDEATACSEAMIFAYKNATNNSKYFFIDQNCHPQNIEVTRVRAEPLGVQIVVGDANTFDFSSQTFCGGIVQYPATDGQVHTYPNFVEQIHKQNGFVVFCTDLLSLTLFTPPGELGADVVVGNSQRFGVPLGYGGPHAAFLAIKDSKMVRKLPGRVVGVSIDQHGNSAYRLSMQTREQHIRREKATSNICTAQALLANVAAMYAVYHGPQGLK